MRLQKVIAEAQKILESRMIYRGPDFSVWEQNGVLLMKNKRDVEHPIGYMSAAGRITADDLKKVAGSLGIKGLDMEDVLSFLSAMGEN